MKPIGAKEGMQLVLVIVAAAVGSVLIDMLPYWQTPLKGVGLLLVIVTIHKIGK